MSFEIILPFLRPIEQFILDEDISEVMVNPGGAVFIERAGEVSHVPGVVLDPKHVEVAVKNIARRLGGDISEEAPILDSRLPDGSRVAAVLAPCSIGGTTLTIRKFHKRWYTVEELVGIATMTGEQASVLTAAVCDRRNILISGGTSTGKTTLLNALAKQFRGERVIVIEETAEIQLSDFGVIRWEARPSRRDEPGVSVRQLVRASLRHRPDRLVIGEVRGGEAFDLLQALNTGHAGSVSTIHANSCEHALTRLTNCVLEAAVPLPYAAIRANIAASIDLVIQMGRLAGKRLVTQLVSVGGYDHVSDKFEFTPQPESTPQQAAAPLRKPALNSRRRFGG